MPATTTEGASTRENARADDVELRTGTEDPIGPHYSTVRDAISTTLDALGYLLRSAYPQATTGDEHPAARFALEQAVEVFVRAWIADNVPTPLTLTEAVAALVEARDYLRGSIPGGDADRDVRDALETITTALARSGMSDDDLPRP